MLKAGKLAIIGAVLATAGAVSYAAKSAHDDAVGIDQAKISIVQAIATAEQHAGGKAASAELEKAKGGASVFEVEVVSGTNVFDVRIDADKGTVISSAKDKMDHDDDNDQDD